MTRAMISAAIAAGVLIGARPAMAQSTLKIGDQAPTISVAKWIKGSPVKSFEKGKVYVVEFWATWCGPCRETIPHLTEMAKKYKGKATFAGISVWETEPGTTDTSYMTKVADFVKEMGNKMDYNVAVDGLDGKMAKMWMEAAGENGIPAAFIVDKNQKIAWIGHPMANMDEVLGKVIAGKFDSKAFGAKRAKEREAEDKRNAALKKVQDLAKEGKTQEALSEINKLAEDPEYAPYAPQLKFNVYTAMLKTDEAAAFKLARQLAENDYKNNAMALNMLAWTMVDERSKLKSPDYSVALSIAQRAAEVSKHEDPMILDTLAMAYYRSGNTAKAIETQERAIELLGKNENYPAEAKKELEDHLAMFKKKSE